VRPDGLFERERDSDAAASAGLRLLKAFGSRMVVALALDELIDVFQSKSEERAQLDDWQLWEAPSCVVADPALGDAKTLGYCKGAKQCLARWL
jgi:hypothetical protein